MLFFAVPKIILFEIERETENWQNRSLPWLCCVRTVSWYARAFVCSPQRGQLYHSYRLSVSLPHHAQPGVQLKKKTKNRKILSVSTTRVSHKQTFSRDACAIKKEPTLLQSEHFALHGFTVVSHGSGLLNSIETAANGDGLLNSIEPAAKGDGLLSGFLTGHRRPLLTVRLIGRGHQEKF